MKKIISILLIAILLLGVIPINPDGLINRYDFAECLVKIFFL